MTGMEHLEPRFVAAWNIVKEQYIVGPSECFSACWDILEDVTIAPYIRILSCIVLACIALDEGDDYSEAMPTWYLKEASEIIKWVNTLENAEVYDEDWLLTKEWHARLMDMVTISFALPDGGKWEGLAEGAVEALRLLKAQWRREDFVQEALHRALHAVDGYKPRNLIKSEAEIEAGMRSVSSSPLSTRSRTPSLPSDSTLRDVASPSLDRPVIPTRSKALKQMRTHAMSRSQKSPRVTPRREENKKVSIKLVVK